MSNDDYMKLYKQFEPMIMKLVNKWSKFGLIEKEDLMQIAMLSLVYSYNHYDASKGASFASYVYSNIEFAIKKELNRIKHQDRDCVSLQTPLNVLDDENMTLEDTLQDDTDIQEEIQSKIMINYYEAECKRVLPKDKFQVCYLRWFENMPYKAIEKVTEKNNISGILLQAQSLLLAKSRVFNEEYKKLVGISEYSTERLALL